MGREHDPKFGWKVITTDPEWATAGAPDALSAGIAFRVQELMMEREAEVAKKQQTKPTTYTATAPAIHLPKGAKAPKLTPNGVKLKGTTKK
jgi:hypothetical protein